MFDQHDWKYWDSILPVEKKGQGKYAHLIVTRSGEVIGLKPGYNRDGTKKDGGMPSEALIIDDLDPEEIDKARKAN